MKIRYGFVSNSSSASYIVKIKDIGFNDFCDVMRSEYAFHDLFSVNVMLDRCNKYLESICDEPNLSDFSKSFKERVEADKKELEALDTENFYQVVRFALKFYQIKFKENEYGIELVDFTSMHNDYVSGVSDVMKEIVLYFLFSKNYEMKCEFVDGDSWDHSIY